MSSLGRLSTSTPVILMVLVSQKSLSLMVNYFSIIIVRFRKWTRDSGNDLKHIHELPGGPVVAVSGSSHSAIQDFFGAVHPNGVIVRMPHSPKESLEGFRGVLEKLGRESGELNSTTLRPTTLPPVHLVG